MGGCVSSTHKTVHESSMKAGLSFTPANLVIPPSPVKQKPANGVPTVQSFLSSPTSKDLDLALSAGSKDDAFFDSQPWLDSDCEDDFYSVRGDFTPSRGNTPVHHNFSVNSTPGRINKSTSDNKTPTPIPAPSPTEKKKKLLELFRESVREGPVEELPRKSAASTPNLSGRNSDCSSERTANGGASTPLHRLKLLRSVHCCLPNLVSCGSFSERKRMSMSPAISVND